MQARTLHKWDSIFMAKVGQWDSRSKRSDISLHLMNGMGIGKGQTEDCVDLNQIIQNHD